ncbi:MAG TPA: DUF664 domain-containing protein [Arachnia sp.]|nr:DUF664 domain-containing protein [Arachnia sp.]HMT86824.1 DUF664 domain-containing protein [Arachnia sp.]
MPSSSPRSSSCSRRYATPGTRILARHDLDDRFDDGRGEIVDVRWVVVHLIQEAVRYVGHLDILREQLDGSTGE